MEHEHIKLVSAAKERVRRFDAETTAMHSVSILSERLVNQVLNRCANDAAAARRNLLGLYQKRPPHELGLPTDDHITGKVGGLARKGTGYPLLFGSQTPKAISKSRLRLLAPITRSIRPTNSGGVTSFHFSFEAITRNHTKFGLTTSSGRRARPDEHGKYLEDAEKFDKETLSAPIDPQSFAHYQEREQALGNRRG